MATSYSFKPIVTNGLVLYVDAANTKSYIGSGPNWIDLSLNDRDVILGGGGTNSVVFTNNTLVNIPDSDADGITSSVYVSNLSGSSNLVSLTIDSITHPYVADLVIRLKAPNSSEITLSSSNGGDGDNYTSTVFSADAINSITTGTAPFTGTYSPQETFSNLTGPINGTWSLRVFDISGSDVGTLDSWNITFFDPIIGGSPTFDNNNVGSLYFNGTSAYGAVGGDFLSGLSSATIETWFNISSVWSGDRVLSYKGTISGAGTNHFGLVVRNSNQVVFFADDISSFKQVNGTDNKSTNIWYHACGVYNGSQLILYINGVEEGTRASKTSPLNSSSNEFRVGSSSLSNFFFNGKVSNVRIYNRALSQSEILQNYNAIKNRYI